MTEREQSDSSAWDTDSYSIATYPTPRRLLRVRRRPPGPVVMVNLLTFRERATGAYAHLTGREAYDRYAESVQRIQGPMGSKMLWVGRFDEVGGESRPAPFHVGAVLQYANPQAFLEFAMRGGAETKARAAGLLGQWLLATTTLSRLSSVTSYPVDAPALVELISDETVGTYLAREDATRSAGGTEVWRGRVDSRVIGDGPAFDEVVVTAFPDAVARGRAVTAYRAVHQGARHWWLLPATTKPLLAGLT